jgi:hypothetical protein
MVGIPAEIVGTPHRFELSYFTKKYFGHNVLVTVTFFQKT